MAKKQKIKHDGLNDRQRLFCEEYLKDLNATEAAIRAGYSKKTARFIGSENLTKPNIQLLVRELQDKRAKRTEITADRVLKELAEIGFSDIKNYMSWDKRGVSFIPSCEIENTKAISEVSESTTIVKGVKRINLKMRMYNKVDALIQIGDHLGMWGNKDSKLSEEDTEKLLKASEILITENV